MFASQGPKAYHDVFEKEPDETLEGEQIFQPKTKGEFDSMLRQIKAEGMLGDG